MVTVTGFQQNNCGTAHNNVTINVALQMQRYISLENDIKLLAYQGAVSIRKTVLPGMAIPMLKIRRPTGRLIFNTENAIRR